MHHPFTSVNVQDMDKIDSRDRDVLASIRANAYDLVINGQEAGGGSIRIHTPEMQHKMFEILGMSEETIKIVSDFRGRVQIRRASSRRSCVRS